MERRLLGLKVRHDIIQGLKRQARRAAWAVAEQAVGPGLQILVTPFLLRWLGAPEFGLWMLAQAFSGMGRLASLGAGTAAVKHVSSDLGLGNRERAALAVRAAVTVTLVLGGAILLLVVVGAKATASGLFERMGSKEVVSGALILGAVNMVLQELDGVFSSALRGALRYDLAATIESVARVALGGMSLLMAWRFRTAAAILVGAAVITVLKLTAKAVVVGRILLVQCWLPTLDRSEIRRVTDFGRWQWIQSIGAVMFSVVDRMLVGSWLGASDLARYGVCLQLAQWVHALPAAAVQVIFPWLSAKVARGEQPAIRQLKFWALVGGGGCLVVPFLLIPIAHPLLRLWLNASFAEENAQILQLLLLGFGVLAFSVPSHYILLGLGEVRFVSLSNLAAGAMAVAASVAWLPFGLVGVAAAKLAYGPVILMNYRRLVRKQL